MEEIKLSPGIQLLIFLVLMFFMGALSELVFAMFLPFFVDTTIKPEDIDLADPTLLLARYFFYSTFSFILSFILFLKFTRQKFADVIHIDRMKLKQTLIVIGIVVGAMVVMEILLLVNEPLKDLLPNNYLIEMELESEQHQFALMDHDNPIRLVFTLFIVAFIPAVGEELVFRGLLMRKLFESSNNRHFAIIVSGIIFAGMHLSPLQLLPMIFMGICFGYVYWHTKNIKYPILMHFINNASMILAIYVNPELMG